MWVEVTCPYKITNVLLLINNISPHLRDLGLCVFFVSCNHDLQVHHMLWFQKNRMEFYALIYSLWEAGQTDGLRKLVGFNRGISVP